MAERKGHGGFSVLALFFIQTAAANDPAWIELEGCKLVEGPHNDGDSVEVEYDGQTHVFRLFFVDCVEKSPHSRERRVEQAKYFGLAGDNPEEDALQVASAAAKFTTNQLSAPFTIRTRWEKADPTGKNPAIRAFVETSTGADLSTLLVGEGLAIIREGKLASDNPKGRNSSEQIRSLREAETRARLAGKGAWGLSRPPASGARPQAVPRSEFAATDKDGLLASAGRPAAVRGRVATIGALPDGRITFLDFEGNQTGGFVGVIRAGFLPLFHQKYPEGLKKALIGKEVALEGVITLYRDIPQIELEHPRQLKILPGPTPAP